MFLLYKLLPYSFLCTITVHDSYFLDKVTFWIVVQCTSMARYPPVIKDCTTLKSKCSSTRIWKIATIMEILAFKEICKEIVFLKDTFPNGHLLCHLDILTRHCFYIHSMLTPLHTIFSNIVTIPYLPYSSIINLHVVKFKHFISKNSKAKWHLHCI